MVASDHVAWSRTLLAVIRAEPKSRDGDYCDTVDGCEAYLRLANARMTARTTNGGDGEFAVQSSQEHYARELARRFYANTYMRLEQATKSHDVGRATAGCTCKPPSCLQTDGGRRCEPPLQSAQRRQPVRTELDEFRILDVVVDDFHQFVRQSVPRCPSACALLLVGKETAPSRSFLWRGDLGKPSPAASPSTGRGVDVVACVARPFMSKGCVYGA